MTIEREQLLGLQSFSTEEEYRESSSLNYSLLKDLVNGPKALIEARSLKPSPALAIGQFVDKYFTAREDLYNIYNVDTKRIILSDSIEALFQWCVMNNLWEPSNDALIDGCRELALFSKMGNDKILERISPLFYEKLENTKKGAGKIQLSEEEHAKSFASINNVEYSPAAMELITEGEDQIVLHQFKIEFPLKMDSGNTRMFKAMLDFLKIDFKNNTITGIDLKTGDRHPHKFYDQFIEYRYDVQGILYYWAMLAIRREIKSKLGLEMIVPTSRDFKFLYSPKIANKTPLIVSLDDDWCRANGEDSLTHKGVTYPGMWRLISDADWYLTNQEFNNHRMIAEGKVHTISQLENYFI
jgi:hypothetical protein